MKSLRFFVSYSRSDASDFAIKLKEKYEKEGHKVFVDIESIEIASDWENTIKNEIKNSDIVLVIFTRGALRSLEIEKEVEEAKKQQKRIIPCRFHTVSWDELKWGLERIQGIEFDNENSLKRNLDDKIFKLPLEQKIKHKLKDLKILTSIVSVTIIIIILIIVFSQTTEINKQPISVPGIDQNVNESTFVTLDGSKSYDPEGKELSYSWKQTRGTNVDLLNNNTVKPYFKTPDILSKEILIFSLKVTDVKNISDTSTVTVDVENINKPPIAKAIIDKKIANSGDRVMLDGSQSVDSDSTAKLSYLWKIIKDSKISETKLSNPISSQVTFIAPSVLSNTLLKFELTVTDKEGTNDTTTVEINVIPTKKYIESYRDFAKYGILFQYPSNWTKKIESTNFTLTLPQLKNKPHFLSNLESTSVTPSFWLSIRNHSNPNESLKEYSDYRLNKLKNALANRGFNLISHDSILLNTTSFSNLLADKIEFTLNIFNLMTIKYLNIWTITNNKVYIVEYSAGLSDYEKYLPVIGDIINSIRIRPLHP